MKLFDIPSGSKIMCCCSDGSKHLIFHHIDGMYSFCRTEMGGIAHLYCMTELSALPDGSYQLEDDPLAEVASEQIHELPKEK